MVRDLSSERVRNACDPASLGIESTEGMPVAEAIIGQRRALEALQFGLAIQEHGYNVYVAGIPGTGRTTAVQAFLEESALGQERPSDWCYVNNFQDPYRPRALELPAGLGRQFQRDMAATTEHVGHDIRQAFDSEEYSEKRESAQGELEQQQQALFKQMQERAQEAGFMLQLTAMGMVFMPVRDGKPVEPQAFQSLGAEERQELEKRQQALQEELKSALREAHGLDRSRRERVRGLDREVARYATSLSLEGLLEKYREIPGVLAYLEAVQEDILDNIDVFRSPEEKGEGRTSPVPWPQEEPLRKYEVNVIVDNGGDGGAPVVMELNPTYQEVFGRVEKEARLGALYTDFTLIRGGSIHRANGGYLVVPVEELLRNLLVWDGLKRALRNREITMEELGERLGFVTTQGLRPEPIPLDVKVILIGSPLIYHLLYQLDEDFTELFKVKADFDTRMERTEENVQAYLSSICRLCEKESLKPLDKGGAAKVIEQSSRRAEHQGKLSTHFAEIADLIREGSFWAEEEGQSTIGATQIQRAVEARVYRSSLIQERIQEMIQDGSLLIDTEGQAVGRLNGLAVVSLGDHAFGRPSRITASVGPGRGGIVDIEREAKLGGPIHTKGVLILSGYLMNQYAQDKPLSLAARLVFEQSYEGVEGDSASSTELYALLSALSGLPLRQDIAVTGSVNQQGQVQAIGGVNEKIEGFYEVCRARGLSGSQGVIIPASNAQNLMVKEEVVVAVADGRFHIWPVRTIDEGIEVLTGAAPGERSPDGSFPKDTVHYKVNQRLSELTECMLEDGEDEDWGRRRKKAAGKKGRGKRARA